MKVTTNWVSHLAFDATSDSGQTIRLDTTIENGSLGSGMNPKKLMLASLCGCSGIDVVEILNKMKVPFTKLSIEATAEQTDTIPKVFSVIHMVYKADVDENQLDQNQLNLNGLTISSCSKINTIIWDIKQGNETKIS
jgi:putative redox protein